MPSLIVNFYSCTYLPFLPINVLSLSPTRHPYPSTQSSSLPYPQVYQSFPIYFLSWKAFSFTYFSLFSLCWVLPYTLFVKKITLFKIITKLVHILYESLSHAEIYRDKNKNLVQSHNWEIHIACYTYILEFGYLDPV